MSDFRNKLTKHISVGGGAIMEIPIPVDDEIGCLEWHLRYGDINYIRYTAASVVESFAYLIGQDISVTEAIRRLRILRKARKSL